MQTHSLTFCRFRGLHALWLVTILSIVSVAGAQSSVAHGRSRVASQVARDGHGSTPLIAAAAAGDVGTVKSLLSAKTELNATDEHGRTALIAAVDGGQVEAAKALVVSGADLDIEAKYLGSALNVAENSGNTELASYLLAAGARSTGKSVGDTVCVRSWGGEGFCGRVKAFSVRSVQLTVTKLVGCAEGCSARQECSASNPVGGPGGIHPGEAIAVPSWCLTDTAVKQ